MYTAVQYYFRDYMDYIILLDFRVMSQGSVNDKGTNSGKGLNSGNLLLSLPSPSISQ